MIKKCSPLILVALSLSLAACQSEKDSASEKPTMSPESTIEKAKETTVVSATSRIKGIAAKPPVANRVDHLASHHGKELKDPYFWLRDPGYPKVDDEAVLNHLTAENAYYHEFLDPHADLVEKVFQEFKGRTDETEESVPYTENGYQYQWFYREGQEYRTRSRKNLESSAEQVFLDESALAEGHDYYDLGDWEIGPNNRYLAYSFNTAGDERYQVKIQDLETGEFLDDELNDVQGQVAFTADGKALIYALLEKDRWHSKHIKVHTIGQPQSADTVLYREDDDGFFIGFDRTSSREYFVIASGQGEIQETYVVPTDLSTKPVQLVSRDQAFQQNVDHAHGDFYIIANDTHKNGRLVKVSDQNPIYEQWQTLQSGSDDVYLLGIQTFAKFIALKSRDVGLDKIHIRSYEGESYSIDFPETVFTASIGLNSEFDQDFVRLNYESMITPDTIFDYALVDKKLRPRKVKKIPSGYDKSDYVTERVMAPARDGVLVPVTLVYKKGFKKDASQPMWLYGYGAYSATITPRFDTLVLSALDRGFSYAIAHVRGGSMLGYQWYLDGKLEKRTNTFNDFVDVANYLVKEKYVAAGNISASGRSAGGELMGAVTIQAPQMWRSVNLGVPFVDVLNTMLDATLPLTPPEWAEWGNPITDPAAFDFIQSYSPYDNIEARDYPPMFVSGGLNDPRVTYWEPAKWTAKMRHTKTDDNLLVQRINMGAGHFANTGRYGRLKDYAEEYVFMFLA
ncbi:MAG: oligopeptidase B, partial [Arenicella sp.]